MIKTVVRKSDNKIMNFDGTGHGTFSGNEKFETVKIPDQDIDQFYEQTEVGKTLKEIYYPDDVTTYDNIDEEPPPDNSMKKRLERIERNIEVERKGKKEKLGPPPWTKDRDKRKG